MGNESFKKMNNILSCNFCISFAPQDVLKLFIVPIQREIEGTDMNNKLYGFSMSYGFLKDFFLIELL